MAHWALAEHFLLKGRLLLLLEGRLRVKETALDVLSVRLVASAASDHRCLLLGACAGRGRL